MKELRWSERSAHHLEQIRDFVASDNPQAASQLVEELIIVAERLEKFPELGRIIESGLRQLVYGNYLIIYRIVQDVISIEAILHSKRKH